MTKKTFKVEGMMCQNCANRLTAVLSALGNVGNVKVSLENKTASLTTDTCDDTIIRAITDAGFEVTE